MAVQSSYSETMRPGLEGMMVSNEDAVFVSKNVETVAGIGYGKAVARGALDDGIVIPTGSAVSIGLTVRQHNEDANNPGLFPRYESARVMLKGRIWAIASVAVVPGDPVYVVPTTGALQKSNASSAIQIPDATWESTAGIGELAKLRIR